MYLDQGVDHANWQTNDINEGNQEGFSTADGDAWTTVNEEENEVIEDDQNDQNDQNQDWANQYPTIDEIDQGADQNDVVLDSAAAASGENNIEEETVMNENTIDESKMKSVVHDETQIDDTGNKAVVNDEGTDLD